MSYDAGSIVWMKLKTGPVWWVGEVTNEYPEDLLVGHRITPIAVVKFFSDENVFEIIKKESEILLYTSDKKEELIRKGKNTLAKNEKDLAIFISDCKIAESLTGGDEAYVDSIGKTVNTPKKSLNEELFKEPVQLTPTKLTPLPGQIKFPFKKPGGSPSKKRNSVPTPQILEGPQVYHCDVCGFQASRVNVLATHRKQAHTSGSRVTTVSSPKPKSTVKVVSSPVKSASPKKATVSPKAKATPAKRGRKRKVTKDSPVAADKQEILADWSDDEEANPASPESVSDDIEPKKPRTDKELADAFESLLKTTKPPVLIEGSSTEEFEPSKPKDPTPETAVKGPSPAKEVISPSPAEEVKSPSLAKAVESPSPAKEVKSPSPVKELKSPSKEVKSPSPAKEVKSPIPAKEVKSPIPAKEVKSPSPAKEVKSPSPAKEVKSPSPAKEVKNSVDLETRNASPKTELSEASLSKVNLEKKASPGNPQVPVRTVEGGNILPVAVATSPRKQTPTTKRIVPTIPFTPEGIKVVTTMNLPTSTAVPPRIVTAAVRIQSPAPTIQRAPTILNKPVPGKAQMQTRPPQIPMLVPSSPQRPQQIASQFQYLQNANKDGGQSQYILVAQSSPGQSSPHYVLTPASASASAQTPRKRAPPKKASTIQSPIVRPGEAIRTVNTMPAAPSPRIMTTAVRITSPAPNQRVTAPTILTKQAPGKFQPRAQQTPLFVPASTQQTASSQFQLISNANKDAGNQVTYLVSSQGQTSQQQFVIQSSSTVATSAQGPRKRAPPKKNNATPAPAVKLPEPAKALLKPTAAIRPTLSEDEQGNVKIRQANQAMPKTEKLHTAKKVVHLLPMENPDGSVTYMMVQMDETGEGIQIDSTDGPGAPPFGATPDPIFVDEPVTAEKLLAGLTQQHSVSAPNPPTPTPPIVKKTTNRKSPVRAQPQSQELLQQVINQTPTAEDTQPQQVQLQQTTAEVPQPQHQLVQLQPQTVEVTQPEQLQQTLQAATTLPDANVVVSSGEVPVLAVQDQELQNMGLQIYTAEDGTQYYVGPEGFMGDGTQGFFQLQTEGGEAEAAAYEISKDATHQYIFVNEAGEVIDPNSLGIEQYLALQQQHGLQEVVQVAEEQISQESVNAQNP